MTQYNILNVKLSNSQRNKLKSAIKTETEVDNEIGDNETNSPHKLLLTNRQVNNLRKAFANYLSIDINLLKTQLDTIRRIFWQITWSTTKNKITINKRCDETIS